MRSRLDRIIVLLEALCKERGIRVTPAKPWPIEDQKKMGDEMLALARLKNHGVDVEEQGDFPTSTTTPEKFWGKTKRRKR